MLLLEVLSTDVAHKLPRYSSRTTVLLRYTAMHGIFELVLV